MIEALTDRIDKYVNSDFEMVAESSMKPFANLNSLHRPGYGMDRTDINTTPSSADKLQRSLRKSHLTIHSSHDHFDLPNIPNLQLSSSVKSLNPLSGPNPLMAAMKQSAL
jgi:hypothetical protein